MEEAFRKFGGVQLHVKKLRKIFSFRRFTLKMDPILIMLLKDI